MKLDGKGRLFFSFIKKLILFFILFTIVLLSNVSVISFNLMYPEQPSIYLINQTIHQFSDLLNIYLHPQLLNQNIPFFRPSGHFLLYQLITPFLGWHNTKAFIIVNFLFLALIGYSFLTIYQRLFPGFKAGGYVAFSLYLMHPALSLARLTIMHFEFAYVFFLMLSLYIFIIFCQRNRNYKTYNSIYLLVLSLFLYVIAVTFKEPAVMLGPVSMCYFWIYFYDSESLKNYFYKMMTHRKTLGVMITITLVSFLLGLYIIASWPKLNYPITFLRLDRTFGAINSFLIDVCGANFKVFDKGYLVFPDLAWRTIIFPYPARLMFWFFLCLSCLTSVLLFTVKPLKHFFYQKSIIFLLTSAILFLILPFAWGGGGPWHYTLTLVALNLIMGFSLEGICHLFHVKKTFIYFICLSFVVCNIYLTFVVNEKNIQKYDQLEDGSLGLAVNRNAVLHPPDIKNYLTRNSVIVVEDSILHNDYLMGNSAYPFLLFLGDKDYDKIKNYQDQFFLQYSSIYGGNLFRYAYLMPKLKEQLYPFHAENMNDVSNEIIYKWLKHYNDIFCLGYDKDGNWHNKTTIFKQNLMKEKIDRDLQIHHYTKSTITFNNNTNVYTESLSYPDWEICQYKCDQDKDCVGFTYQYVVIHQISYIQCHYSNTKYLANNNECINCIWYSKKL